MDVGAHRNQRAIRFKLVTNMMCRVIKIQDNKDSLSGHPTHSLRDVDHDVRIGGGPLKIGDTWMPYCAFCGDVDADHFAMIQQVAETGEEVLSTEPGAGLNNDIRLQLPDDLL